MPFSVRADTGFRPQKVTNREEKTNLCNLLVDICNYLSYYVNARFGRTLSLRVKSIKSSITERRKAASCPVLKPTIAKQPKDCDAKLQGLNAKAHGSQLPKGVSRKRIGLFSRRFSFLILFRKSLKQIYTTVRQLYRDFSLILPRFDT